MKLTSRHAVCVFALAVPLVIGGASNLTAEPQSARGLEKGKGHYQRQYDPTTNPNYQQGWRDGQGDRVNNRPHQYRERNDARNTNIAENRAYEAGYDAGFRPTDGQFGRLADRNDNYNTSSRNFKQGLRDGQGDRANNRPHQYRYRADPRNNSVAQNRDYDAGYDQGYGGNNGRDNRANDRNRIGITAATRPNYEQGMRDGQGDRANNRPHQYRERADPRNNNMAENRAYEAGYDQGFSGNNGRYNGQYDPRRQDGQYGQGQYGQYSNNNNNVAARNGQQDGLFDGQKDRQTGHSNRPTQGDWYKSATRGYDSSLGDREQYKAVYRQAYLPAYQSGYTRQNGTWGNGQYGQYGNNNVAARNGQQDGLFDGQKDRQTGHSNRPTQGDWYKSANRGYDSSLGDREQYKVVYRNAYLPAYQRGYTGQ